MVGQSDMEHRDLISHTKECISSKPLNLFRMRGSVLTIGESDRSDKL
jgi:hypothetical protein